MMAKDIMEGYTALNPLVLKKFDAASYQEMHQHLRKLQNTVRTEGVSLSNQEALRNRNQRLQRLHQALSVIEHQAKLQRIVLV
jgi:hypothetical protein